MKSAEPKLKWKMQWLFIGYVLIFIVIYLSLTSSPVDIDIGVEYRDKIFHALAYFSLMFWFAQIYYDSFRRNFFAVFFIALGIALEYLQGFDPKRVSDTADMLANTSGVVLGFIFALTPAKSILAFIDSKLP